jgi:hypothetical protein
MAAGSTYTPIATYTASGSVSTVTFSSIPSTYTDLVLIGFAKDSNNYTGMRVNNDSSSIYSRTIMTWNGSSAGSSRTSGANTLYVGGNDTNYEVTRYNFMNYSNTTPYKTILGVQTIANATSVAQVGLWRSTSAINEIDIYSVSGATILAGTTWTLYGIQAA